MTTRSTSRSAAASIQARRRRMRVVPRALLRGGAGRRGSGSGAGSSTGNPAATESGQTGSRVTWTSGPPAPGTAAGAEDLSDDTASEQEFEQRCRPGNGALSSLKASGGKVAGSDVFSARCSRLPLAVSSTGVGGWAERASRRRGAAQVRGRSFNRAGGRRVDHTASCPWPGPTTECAISCGSVSRMSLQVARSTKLTESSTCCIVAPPVGPALMSRSLA